MYICNCTALRDSEIRSAIENGARSVAEVFRSLDEEQSCGKCTPEVREMIGEVAGTTTDSPVLVVSNS